MSKNILITTLVIIVVAIIALAYILSQGSMPINSPTPSPAASATPTPSITQPAQNPPQTISIKNFSFTPGTLTIKKGSTVSWINEDSAQHTIKFSTITSSKLDLNQTFSTSFSETGTFDYSCGIHPNMKGKIIVQ